MPTKIKNQSLILGVDPGINGGLALLSMENKLITTIKIPIWAPKTKKEIDTLAINLFFARWAMEIGLMVIEDVHAYPDQGVTSVFRFGEAKGILIGLAAAYLIPIVKIAPVVWKSDLGLSQDKSRSLSAASRLWPNFSHEFKLKKDADKAEAALIAYFAAKHVKNLRSKES